nr:CopD family protein [Parvularcula mediterranea]
MVIIHVGLAAFWIAAPWTLFPRAGAPPGDLSARLVRFSAIAVWAVPAAFLLGLGLLLRLAGGLEAVFATGYGQLLLLKLFLAVGALGLGAYNKRVVTERILAAPEAGTKLLRRVLASEAVLFGLVLVVVSLATTMTGPDR